MNILTIDIKALEKEIDKYWAFSNKTPYVICSEETAKLIVSKCVIFEPKEELEKIRSKGMIAQFKGCTVLNDNSLSLGEVEIR